MPEFSIENLTPEQTAAYINGTSMVALSELLALHWQNELALALRVPGQPFSLPNGPERFANVATRHCINHQDMMALFDRANKTKEVW